MSLLKKSLSGRVIEDKICLAALSASGRAGPNRYSTGPKIHRGWMRRASVGVHSDRVRGTKDTERHTASYSFFVAVQLEVRVPSLTCNKSGF